MLDEDRNWAIDIPRLKVSLDEARKHCDPRIMVVVNPGNPTGEAYTCSLIAGPLQGFSVLHKEMGGSDVDVT